MDMRLLVGLNFRKLRAAKGLTQERVSELTGISQQYLSSLEAGRRNPTVVTLFELTDPLGAMPMDLLRPIEEAD
uniref:helix-turn-helix domain-containing protein n=1 Tax=Altererythrobacter segetis TaxID=1104773 RepID=UPI00140CD779|nr:helix-turn-helix transcriptional regulator [Altererythrobacter segetis]